MPGTSPKNPTTNQWRLCYITFAIIVVAVFAMAVSRQLFETSRPASDARLTITNDSSESIAWVKFTNDRDTNEIRKNGPIRPADSLEVSIPRSLMFHDQTIVVGFESGKVTSRTYRSPIAGNQMQIDRYVERSDGSIVEHATTLQETEIQPATMRLTLQHDNQITTKVEWIGEMK
jgi:hypothetical protein